MIKKSDGNVRNVGLEADLIDQAYTGSPVRNKRSNLGLCIGCKHVKAQVTEFGKQTAICGYYYDNPPRGYFYPNPVDPIVECSNFYPKGQLELSDMEKIAILIDIENKQAGFIGDEKEVSFTYPKKKKETEDFNI